MGIFENCLLACDVDGTLICENTIPKDNIEAIEFFIKEGGHFALCTGRSVDALKQVFSFLDKRLAGISIVLGGGMLYDFVSDSIVSQSILSDNDKYFSKYVKENLSNIGIEIHLDGVVNVLNRTDETDIHEEYEKLYCEFKSFEEINHLHWNKVLYALKNEAEREVLLNLAKERGSSTSLFIKTSAFIYGKQYFYVEQMPLGVSKGKAVKELCEILGIKAGGLFGIGDYYNDIDMINKVDIGAATKEAPDDLKKIAKYVTCEAKNAAVADFIKYLTEVFGMEENNG